MPQAIVGSRTITHQGLPIQQVQVQWEGMLPTETTWENWTDFHTLYPNLEDK
ncbi:hypothetical protein A2U01_0076172, partial [Trifolium medium]|nr:hypothetical protein [Trifolium medium]